MSGSRLPGFASLLRAGAFWMLWIVLCYGLVRVAGPPPPEGLEVARWLQAGREWFDRLLDANPTALPDNAALRAAFNAAPRAPESGALLALALWLALPWLALSALLSQGAALALTLLGFGRTAVTLGQAAIFVRAPSGLVVGAIVLLALLVLHHAAAGEDTPAATAEHRPPAAATPLPSPIATASEAGGSPAPQLHVVQPGEWLTGIAEAELGPERLFSEIRNPDGTPLRGLAVAPGQPLLRAERGAHVAAPAATPEGAVVATARADATETAPATAWREQATTGVAPAPVAAGVAPIAPPTPPESTGGGTGWLAGPTLDVRGAAQAATASPLLLPGSAAVSLAVVALLLTRVQVRERLPARRVWRLLRRSNRLPQQERRGSATEAAAVLL